MKYHFRVHKEEDGFWAECIEIPNVNTQADSLEELQANMREVLNLVLSEPEGSRTIFPKPNPNIKGKNVAEVFPDPQIALAMDIRQKRLRDRLTQATAAKRMGYNSIRAWQKLESPSGSNPTLSTLQKLKHLFPDLSIDAILTTQSTPLQRSPSGKKGVAIDWRQSNSRHTKKAVSSTRRKVASGKA